METQNYTKLIQGFYDSLYLAQEEGEDKMVLSVSLPGTQAKLRKYDINAMAG